MKYDIRDPKRDIHLGSTLEVYHPNKFGAKFEAALAFDTEQRWVDYYVMKDGKIECTPWKHSLDGKSTREQVVKRYVGDFDVVDKVTNMTLASSRT